MGHLRLRTANRFSVVAEYFSLVAGRQAWTKTGRFGYWLQHVLYTAGESIDVDICIRTGWRNAPYLTQFLPGSKHELSSHGRLPGHAEFRR